MKIDVTPWLDRTTPDRVVPWLDVGLPVAWTLASLLCLVLMAGERAWMRRSPLAAIAFSYAWPVHLSCWAAHQLERRLVPKDPR